MKQEQIIQVVEHYLLATKSHIALLINGEWGIGKTFFVKGRLQTAMDRHKYKMIYVSLNGVSSSEQLKSIVFSQIVTQGACTPNETVHNFVSKFAKSISNNVFVQSLNPADFIILDKVVICMDDLERISPTYKIADALGCINSEYVESKGYKVILIGNENQNQLKDENYKIIKEKLIGYTVNYENEMPTTLKSIAELWKANPAFKKITDEHLDFILETLQEINCQNLRTVLFTFDCLAKIAPFIQHTDQAIIKTVIYSTFVVANGYKKALPIHHLAGKPYAGLFKDREQTDEEKEKAQFSRVWWSHWQLGHNIKFKYSNSVYDFITKGFLDEPQLKIEVDAWKQEWDAKKHDEDRSLINNLGGFPNLSNAALKYKLNLLYEKIEYGSFSIENFLFACSNILLLERHQLAMKNRKALYDLFSNNFHKTLENYSEKDHKSGSNRRHLSEITHYYPDLGDNLKQQLDTIWQALSARLFEDFVENWNIGIRRAISFKNILKSVNISKLAETIIAKVENRKYIGEIVDTLTDECKDIDSFKLDKEKLRELKDEIKKLAAIKQFELIDKYVVEEIVSIIEKTIE